MDKKKGEGSEGDGKKEEFMPGYQTVQQFSADGMKRVINGVKAFHALPQPGPSWDLYKSYPEYSRAMKNARSKIVPMMASLLKHVNIPTSDFRSRDIDEQFEFLVESNDDMLERIGSSLDEAEGLFKKSEMVVIDKGLANSSLKTPGTWGKRKLDSINALSNDTDSTSNSRDVGSRPIKKPVFRLRVTEKPQLKFSKAIDNSLSPFVPKLKEKPNSLKPLSILPEYTSKNEEFFGHPYTVELNKWEPNDNLLTKVIPQPPKDPKDTPVVFVGTPRDLERLMYDLLNTKEIAVDLEHHSYRTYLGLTCLIQISTREKDYVIDGLSLREELCNLNEILTDPKVVKVFHGSSSDIDWLQRDYGLYIVNMFDTYIAAKILGLPQLSLQYLLGKYCNVSQNKSLQLADWRLRPLPDEMLEYARLDTHYLLYIYEQLRNELIDSGNQHNNLLLSVFDQSKLTCLKRYEKPVSNAQLALRKTRRSLNNRQLFAFTEMYKWRDETAREKDESLGYVLPNHMLLTIAETLPKEMNGILACCDPVPPLIHSSLGKLHKIITTARELPLHLASSQKDKVQKKTKQKNWIVVVNSIHDVTPIETSETSAENEMEEDMDEDEEFNLKNSMNSAVSGSWPQPWVDPGGWEKFVLKGRDPSLKFRNKSLAFRRCYRHAEPNNSGFPSAGDLSTPFGRYDISKRIVDMLKDPKKQTELDMEDPVVKAVYEAVTVEDIEAVSEVTEQPVAVLERVLDEGDFIPFNPLAEPASKRRKKKHNQKETWDGGKNASKTEDGADVSLHHEDDNDNSEAGRTGKGEYTSSSKSSPLMQPSKNKRDRKGKKKKGKLLNRIKNVFSKNKNRSDNDNAPSVDNDEPDDIQVIEAPESAKKVECVNLDSPPKKRGRQEGEREQSWRGRGRNRRGNNFRSPGGGGDNQRNNSSPQRGRNSRNSDQAKHKTGIFKAWKKDNRSITFK